MRKPFSEVQEGQSFKEVGGSLVFVKMPPSDEVGYTLNAGNGETRSTFFPNDEVVEVVTVDTGEWDAVFDEVLDEHEEAWRQLANR